MRIRSLKSICFIFSMSLIFSNLGFSSDSDDKNDWPRWRGTSSNSKADTDGSFKIGSGSGLKVAWKKSLGSGYSSVSIMDGHAVTMFSDSTNDYVISFDANTGNEQWRYEISATYKGHDGSRNGPISTPVLDADYVYTLGPKGDLLALSLKTGEKAWSTNLTKDHAAMAPFLGFATSPLIYDKVLVVETGGVENTISGFDKNNGKLLWSTGTDTVQYQSPLTISVEGTDQLVCVGDKYLYGLNPLNGEMYWEFRHNGGDMGTNPIFFDNKLFYNKGRQFALLQIEKDGDKFSTKELWTTRHISRTLTPPVYHEGYLYGYNRRFLSCVDAATGESKWKSRPPGDGFLILLDDNLVILTKTGMLHIIKASPEGFQEIASVRVFEKLTWTPPSFANGRIYARNFYEIASIETAKMDQIIAAVAQTEPSMKVPGTEFAKFVERVERASDKKKLLDEFMAKNKTSPVIAGEKYAHIIYRGPAKDIGISGDMLETGVEAAPNRIEGTDFYYASFEIEPDARLDYWMTIDFGRPGPDPRNDTKIPSFFARQVSELAMPKWTHPTHLDEPSGKRGKLDSLNFESKILKNKRTVKVYLPNGYDQGNDSYPVVYVNNGREAIQLMKMTNSLDNLIGKTIEPVIAVFIYSASGQEYARSQRNEYGELVATELVPFIDKKYRTISKPGARLFIGGDEGAYSVVNTAFNHPGVFGNVAGQSMHLAGGPETQPNLDHGSEPKVVFYLDWGKYDYRSSSGGYSWADLNRAFAKKLKKKGYTVHGGEVNQGFGWASWRSRTDKILETFFPIKTSKK